MILGMVICTYTIAAVLLITCTQGSKNVGKELKKITTGIVKNSGKTWFPELVDKSNLRCVIAESYSAVMVYMYL